MARHGAWLAVRWSDIDAFGHLNNARYLTLLEEARVDLFLGADRGDHEAPRSMMRGIVVARHEIDYLRAIDYRGAPLRIDIWVTDIGTASFGVAYEVFDHGGAVAARATSRMVVVDAATGRARRLSPVEAGWLGSWRDTA